MCCRIVIISRCNNIVNQIEDDNEDDDDDDREHLPAAAQQTLAIDLHRTLAGQLVTRQVGIVR